MTTEPNIRLALPFPNPKSWDEMARNMQALTIWANNNVVNKISAGTDATVDSQPQALGSGAQGTGIVTVNSVNSGVTQIVAGTNITISPPGGTGVVTINSTGGGTTFYASLTGLGETTTPGSLTQAGGFTVNDSLGTGILLQTTGANIEMFGTNSGVELLMADSTGSVLLNAPKTGASITLDASNEIVLGATVVVVQSSPAQLLAFFGAGGAFRPNITGSRGGNVALANLLTGLANLGLITDSTTP